MHGRGWGVAALICAACGTGSDTDGSSGARAAVEAVSKVVLADDAATDVIEITTDRSIGERVAAYFARIRALLRSQAPCTTVTTEGNTMILDFGSLADRCTFRGRTYAGVVRVTADDAVEGDGFTVRHEFFAFTNGVIVRDGTLDVTAFPDGARDLAGDEVFANLQDPAILEVTSDHRLERLDPQLTFAEGGVLLNGHKDWTVNARADWSIDLLDLELLAELPAPHAGRVEGIDPRGVRFVIVFDRVDEDTVSATVMGAEGRTRTFHITLGEIEEL